MFRPFNFFRVIIISANDKSEERDVLLARPDVILLGFFANFLNSASAGAKGVVQTSSHDYTNVPELILPFGYGTKIDVILPRIAFHRRNIATYRVLSSVTYVPGTQRRFRRRLNGGILHAIPGRQMMRL